MLRMKVIISVVVISVINSGRLESWYDDVCRASYIGFLSFMVIHLVIYTWAVRIVKGSVAKL